MRDYHFRFLTREIAIAALATAFPEAVVDPDTETFKLYGPGYAIDAFGEVPADPDGVAPWKPSPLYHVNVRVADPSLYATADAAFSLHGIEKPSHPYRSWAGGDADAPK